MNNSLVIDRINNSDDNSTDELKFLERILSLEINILSSLLKRNECCHRRTKYFQRLSMICKSLQRYDIINSHVKQQDLRKMVGIYHQKYKKEQEKSAKKKRRREEEHWVLDTMKENEETKQMKLKEEEDSSTKEIERIYDLYDNIKIIAYDGLPEILSRIDHATMSLLNEISRGFFLPLCTVALSTIARIRIMVMRLGRALVLQLQQSSSLLTSWTSNDGRREVEQDEFLKTMNVFLEESHHHDTNRDARKRQRRQRHKAIFDSIGFSGSVKQYIYNGGDESEDMETQSFASSSSAAIVASSMNDNQVNLTDSSSRRDVDSRNGEDDAADGDLGEAIDIGDTMTKLATGGIVRQEDGTDVNDCETITSEDQRGLNANMDLVKRIQQQQKKKKRCTALDSTATSEKDSELGLLQVDSNDMNTKFPKKKQKIDDDTTCFIDDTDDIKKEKKAKKKKKKKLKKQSSNKKRKSKDIFDEIFG